jgi:hypothetical protein
MRAPRSDVQHDRDRAVVHDLDAHSGAEDARLDGHAELAKGRAERLIEAVRLSGRRSLLEARPIPLRRVFKASDVNRRLEER